MNFTFKKKDTLKRILILHFPWLPIVFQLHLLTRESCHSEPMHASAIASVL